MKTNIEKVTEYMEQSPLNQGFVMQAIDAYAKQVSDDKEETIKQMENCLLYTSPSPRDRTRARMPSSA